MHFNQYACLLLLILTSNACVNHDDDVDSPPITGLDTRPDNQTCVAPDVLATQASDIELQPAFPNLPNLGALVSLLQAPGDDSTWYAVIQSGQVLGFENTASVASVSPFIDIQSQVASGGEMGLLGMAFHPQYADNGEIYLSYTADNPRRSIISRFTYVVDQWQEDVILTVAQPYTNHNGGNIAFGPDGYLYIGLGDGGSGGDPEGHGQNTTSLLGAMLRIDVDVDVNSAAPYAIPTNNPFAGNALCNDLNTVFNSNSCPEIYAWGLRNPWRWSFDRSTDELWVGDVGQNLIEEVDIIQRGNNYGWNIMEGDQCYNATTCNQTDLTLPVAVYSHGDSRSIVGGYVYRGQDADLQSILADTYLYADTYSTRIWGLKQNGTVYESHELINSSLQYIYAFAEDVNGELYILDPAFSSSTPGTNIYKVVAGQPADVNPQPATLLSQTGCVVNTNPTQPAAGLIPYDLISPLWSDGAAKQRFMALPNNTTIDVTAQGDFLFPTGTVLMKNFFLNNRIVETRLLMHHSNGWAGYSYEWMYDLNGNPTDAQLLTTSLSKTIDGQSWYYPDSGECLVCHTNSANMALGPELLQLNRDFHYSATGRSANQIKTLQTIGVFTSALTPEQKNLTLYALDDANASYQQRAKSYLHANCANCHQPGEVNTSTMDLRFLTPLVDMNVCDAIPQRGNLGLSDPRIIDPNGTLAEPNSVLIGRMESTDSGLRMPPLASELVHTQATELLKHWQEALAGCL
jgi:uncharacterized repeat protein (TIGR03806 family)